MPPTLKKGPNFYEADKRAGKKKGKKSFKKKVEEGGGLNEGRRLLIIRRGSGVRSLFVGSRRSRQPLAARSTCPAIEISI